LDPCRLPTSSECPALADALEALKQGFTLERLVHPHPNKTSHTGGCPVLVPALFAGTEPALSLPKGRGNLTWYHQLIEIKIPALSQKTRQERGTLED
jgi:hypothetical protein